MNLVFAGVAVVGAFLFRRRRGPLYRQAEAQPGTPAQQPQAGPSVPA